MPSLRIAFSSRISTSTPSLARAAARSANSTGPEHVRRLVDEVAGQDDAGRQSFPGLVRPLGGGRVGHLEGEPVCRPCRSRRPSSWSCSGRSCRPAAGRRAPCRRPSPGPASRPGRSTSDGRRPPVRGAGHHAAQLREIELRPGPSAPPMPTTIEPIHRERARRGEGHDRLRLALEPLDRSRFLDQIQGFGPQLLRDRRGRLQVLADEDDEVCRRSTSPGAWKSILKLSAMDTLSTEWKAGRLPAAAFR